MKVSTAERTLIEELLTSGNKVWEISQITGRGERTIYYIQAELNRRPQPLKERIKTYVKGLYGKENTRGVGAYRRTEI